MALKGFRVLVCAILLSIAIGAQPSVGLVSSVSSPAPSDAVETEIWDHFGYPERSIDAEGSTLAATHGDSVVVYERAPNIGWSKEGVLSRPSNVTSAFGWAVSVDPDVIAVADPLFEDSRGAVFLYTRGASGSWQITDMFQPDSQGGYFGMQLVAEDRHIAVMAPYDTSGSEDPGNGAAYVFGPSASGWAKEAKLYGESGTRTEIGMDGGVVVFEGRHEPLIGYTENKSGEWVQTDPIPAPDSCLVYLTDLAVGDNGLVVSHVCQVNHVEQDLAFYRQRSDGSWFIEDRREVDHSLDLAMEEETVFRGSAGRVSMFDRQADGSWQMKQAWTSGDPAVGAFGEDVALTEERALVSAPGINRTYSYQRLAVGP